MSRPKVGESATSRAGADAPARRRAQPESGSRGPDTSRPKVGASATSRAGANAPAQRRARPERGSRGPKTSDGLPNRFGDGFADTCGFRLTAAADGRATVELDVAAAVQNVNGNLHGGAIATLVDHAGTHAIVTADRQGRPGVTTDLNVSYFAPAPLGSTVVGEAQVLKIGKTLAFVTVDVRRKGDGALVAQGRMTKFQGG